jgi:hypothetical protein
VQIQNKQSSSSVAAWSRRKWVKYKQSKNPEKRSALGIFNLIPSAEIPDQQRTFFVLKIDFLREAEKKRDRTVFAIR